MTTLMRTRACYVAGIVVVLATCQDSFTGPGQEVAEGSSLTLSYADGGRHEASGSPSLDGNDLSGSTFAVAFRDSVGGVVITSFEQTQGSLGELFVVQLTELRTGAFEPCGVGQECHGRVLERFDARERRATGGPYREIVSGSVQVDEAGPDRMRGSFADLLLVAQDSIRPDRTIESGTFDLELLSDEEGMAALKRLLCEAARPLSGLDCPQAEGRRVSFSFADGEHYSTFGDPAFDGSELVHASFATAFPDSVGGLVISSFAPTQGSRGDLFILQLTERRTGAYGPCGVSQNCYGRLLEEFDVDELAPLGPEWLIVSGSVQVDESTPDRLSGSFAGLLLEAQDSIRPDRTIERGVFDLTPLSEEESVAAMQCFLRVVSGSGSC